MKQQKITADKNTAGPGKASMSRLYVIYAFMLIFAFSIILYAIHLQIFRASELNLEAEKIEFRFDNEIEAMRGSIFSADGGLLATSIPVFEIRMDVASPLITDKLFNDSVTWLAYELSKTFGDYTNWEYKKRLIDARKNGNRYFFIQRNVTFDKLSKLQKMPILNRGKYSGGLIALRSTRREYPYGKLARRTIGYNVQTSASSGIHVGIEGQFNQYLDGKKGRQLLQRMAYGAWKPIAHPSNIEPVNGKNIVTTIDSYLQDVSHNSLLKHLREHDAEKGTVVLMEVKTGKIRAIVNLSLDSADGSYNETYNMAIGELFEPGSTFKVASLMVGIEDGLMQKADSVNIGQGFTMFHGKEMKDSHGIDPDGWLTIEESLIYSSNVGISKLIYDEFQERKFDFYNGLVKVFPAEKTGIEIPGEPLPFIKNPYQNDDRNYWSLVTLPWMSIGYEMMVTPLQVLTFYNAIANNGKMVRPMLVTGIMDGGETLKTFHPSVIKNTIASAKTIQIIREYLEATVERGTASNVRNNDYKIAGKTGTAKVSEGGKYINKYNASFAGYFPADNPKFSCIVVIYKPNKGAYYASQVAAPVFKEIADMVYASEFDIDPVNKHEHIARPAKFSQPEQSLLHGLDPVLAELLSNSDATSFPENIETPLIPDVRGLGAKDALFLLENMGFVVKMTGRGLVKKQSLNPGARFRKGDHIYLTLEI
jgi:cell division protein FtsI (penicillin-binding protein 3)